MTDETLREIEARRHELMEQQRAWRSVEKYISKISDALDVQISQTFDEWEAAFAIIYPDMTAERVRELVAEVEAQQREQ